jgi:hypothetical protein
VKYRDPSIKSYILLAKPNGHAANGLKTTSHVRIAKAWLVHQVRNSGCMSFHAAGRRFSVYEQRYFRTTLRSLHEKAYFTTTSFGYVACRVSIASNFPSHVVGKSLARIVDVRGFCTGKLSRFLATDLSKDRRTSLATPISQTLDDEKKNKGTFSFRSIIKNSLKTLGIRHIDSRLNPTPQDCIFCCKKHCSTLEDITNHGNSYANCITISTKSNKNNTPRLPTTSLSQTATSNLSPSDSHGYIYILHSPSRHLLKIGYSKRPHVRFKKHQKCSSDLSHPHLSAREVHEARRALDKTQLAARVYTVVLRALPKTAYRVLCCFRGKGQGSGGEVDAVD